MVKSILRFAEFLPIICGFFQKCLRELTANEAMRDRLNVEANEISNTYPELQQSVQSMMADLNNLWDALHERITCAFPLWSSKFMLYEPFRVKTNFTLSTLIKSKINIK